MIAWQISESEALCRRPLPNDFVPKVLCSQNRIQQELQVMRSGTGQADQGAVLAFIKEKFQPDWIDTPSLPRKKSKGILKGRIKSKETGSGIYQCGS